MKKNALFVSYDKFPNENAGAIRIYSLAKLFLENGYKVTIIGNGNSTNFKMKYFHELRYISLRNKKNNFYYKVLNVMMFHSRVKKIINSEDFSDIVFVNAYFLVTIKYIIKHAKKNKIRLFYDCVEWFSKSEMDRGGFDLVYRVNNTINTKLIDKNWHVISISRYLEEYYCSKGIDSIRIPVIMSSQDYENFEKKTKEDRIVFIYAGRMGKKDEVHKFINALLELDDVYKNKIEFRIIGTDMNELSKITGISSEVFLNNNTFIKCISRIPRDQVIKNLTESDFSVLFRRSDERYAMAGFPTKVVESMFCSTPIFGNYSSDLNLFLTDMDNSIIVENTVESIKAGIIRVVNFTYQQRLELGMRANQTAKNCFSYDKYVLQFGKWIERI